MLHELFITLCIIWHCYTMSKWHLNCINETCILKTGLLELIYLYPIKNIITITFLDCLPNLVLSTIVKKHKNLNSEHLTLVLIVITYTMRRTHYTMTKSNYIITRTHHIRTDYRVNKKLQQDYIIDINLNINRKNS